MTTQIETFKEGFDIYAVPPRREIIQVQDLPKLLRSLGQNPTEGEIKEFINEFDADGNGDIDFPELLTIMVRMMKISANTDDLVELFRVFDGDGTGYITSAVFKHILSNLGERMTDEEMAQMMKEADNRNMGYINYTDYVNTLLSK